MNLRRVLSTSAVALGAVSLSIGIQALAYTGPTSAPPGGDAYAPLNTSNTGQTKQGGLILGTGTGVTNAVRAFTGNVYLDSGDVILRGGAINDTGRVSTPTLCLGKVTDGSRVCKSDWASIAGSFSLTQGTGIILTPSPITTTGSVAVDDTYVLNTTATQQTKAGNLQVNGKVRLGGNPASLASDVMFGVNGKIRIEGGNPTAGAVLTSAGTGGDATWQKPTQVRAGLEVGDSTSHTVGFTPAMPDTSYAITITNGTSSSNSGDCYRPVITGQTVTSFTFNTPDSCSNVPYNWIAVDY